MKAISLLSLILLVASVGVFSQDKKPLDIETIKQRLGSGEAQNERQLQRDIYARRVDFVFADHETELRKLGASEAMIAAIKIGEIVERDRLYSDYLRWTSPGNPLRVQKEGVAAGREFLRRYDHEPIPDRWRDTTRAVTGSIGKIEARIAKDEELNAATPPTDLANIDRLYRTIMDNYAQESASQQRLVCDAKTKLLTRYHKSPALVMKMDVLNSLTYCPEPKRPKH